MPGTPLLYALKIPSEEHRRSALSKKFLIQLLWFNPPGSLVNGAWGHMLRSSGCALGRNEDFITALFRADVTSQSLGRAIPGEV